GCVLLGELHLEPACLSLANVLSFRGLHLCIEASITSARLNEVDDEILGRLLLTQKVIIEPGLPVTPLRDQKPEDRFLPFADVVPLVHRETPWVRPAGSVSTLCRQHITLRATGATSCQTDSSVTFPHPYRIQWW